MKSKDELFLSLLEPEQAKLLRIAVAITGQEHDAWDMVQDATVAAYRSFKRFDGGPDKFGPWLRRILVNRCRNLLRARGRLLPLEPAVEGATADPDRGPEERLDHALLWGEVMELEAHHRQVLTLRFLVDMSLEDIGDLLAVPTGTIKSRLHRALKALRSRLDVEAKREVNGDATGRTAQGGR